MVMSSSAGKSTERRIQKDQNILTYPIHFLPHPKIGPGTKMTQDDLKPKNVPNYNLLWSAMFSDMLHQKHWRLKLSPKQLAHYYHSIRKLKSKTRKVNRKLNTKLEGLKWLNYKINNKSLMWKESGAGRVYFREPQHKCDINKKDTF